VTAPKRKQVSTHVMEKVSLALQQMAGDPAMSRTKVQVEKLTGLGRDAVARAFRQDREQPDRRYRLNAKFDALKDAKPQAGESGSGAEDAQQVKELRARNKDLERVNAAFAQALFARELTERSSTLRIVED
jgi:hypothetical protein